MSEEFEKLTNDQINEKITKLNGMMAFYRYTQNEDLCMQLDIILENCYNILNDRAEMVYFEENIGMNTGVVLDNFKNSEADKKDDRKTRRKGGLGGPL